MSKKLLRTGVYCLYLLRRAGMRKFPGGSEALLAQRGQVCHVCAAPPRLVATYLRRPDRAAGKTVDRRRVRVPGAARPEDVCDDAARRSTVEEGRAQAWRRSSPWG